MEVPAFGRMADVCCVQQQGQSFGLINAVKTEYIEHRAEIIMHISFCHFKQIKLQYMVCWLPPQLHETNSFV